MRWRFGGGPFGACNGLWWVQRGLRLYRLHRIPRGYSAQGLTRKVAGRSETREYRTLYGAKMAVEEACKLYIHGRIPSPLIADWEEGRATRNAIHGRQRTNRGADRGNHQYRVAQLESFGVLRTVLRKLCRKRAGAYK